MRFPYQQLKTQRPVATLGGVWHRYKPILPVRVSVNGRTWVVEGLLDSGSDDTVLPGPLAERLGVVLDGRPTSSSVGVGGRPIPYAVVEVLLSIHDGQTGCQWKATAEFRGDSHEVILSPNSTFSGAIP